MKYAALLLLSAVLLNAQTPFEIRGTVSEPRLGGIAGAEVHASVQGTPGAPFSTITVFTDGRGEFVVRTTTPGSYTLRVLHDGYLQTLAGGSVVVDRDHPRVDRPLQMVRLGQITGRVVDAETREPVEGVEVFAMQRLGDLYRGTPWSPAFTLPLGAVTVANREDLARQMLEERTTKRDGTFTITSVRPGDYAVTLVKIGEPLWNTSYSPDDLKVIDQEIEASFWPGGMRADEAHPIPLGSGAVLSFGDIPLKKSQRYRAHVSLRQGSCPMGESMRVTLFKPGEPTKEPSVFPCGSELLLRGLEPGSYFIYAVSDWQGERDQIENAAWVTTQFNVADKNIEVTLVPQRGIVLEGQLIAAEGVAELPERFSLVAQPDELAPGVPVPSEQFVEWLPDRKFRMVVSPRPQTFSVRFRDTVYVKQIRYNGSPLGDLKVPINPGGAAQRVEIVLDDKFGSLSGTVTDGGRLLSRSSVLLWKEGAAIPEMVGAPDGTFRFGGLAPGEYRVSASIEEPPGLLMADRTNAGEKVTIRPGEAATINVRVTGASK